MIKTWQDIPGFFDFADIYDQAVDEAKDGDTLVEVGAFLGKSAAYMAEQIKLSGKDLRFFVVDSWDETAYAKWWTLLDNDPPSPWPKPELYDMPLMVAFEYCMDRVGARGSMCPLAMPSVSAARIFPDEGVGFVFIDANHQYPGISADIAAWWRKVKQGGILAGHDYTAAIWPDVKRAVDEAFPAIEQRGSSWMVRK